MTFEPTEIRQGGWIPLKTGKSAGSFAIFRYFHAVVVVNSRSNSGMLHCPTGSREFALPEQRNSSR
jgi:hypothetical protein